MASEVHKLFDETVGQIKRVGNTAERLKDAETQFEQDQKSIDDVNVYIIISLKIESLSSINNIILNINIMLVTIITLCILLL